MATGDGSNVLAGWRADSKAAIVGWRDRRLAQRDEGRDGRVGSEVRGRGVKSQDEAKYREAQSKGRKMVGGERSWARTEGWRLEVGGQSKGCGLRAGGRLFSRWVAGQEEHAETIDGARGRATLGSSGRQMGLQNSKSCVRLCLSLSVVGGVKRAERIPLKDVAGWWEPGRSQD